MKKNKLTILQHDDDTVTIEGTRYSNEFFRELGCSFPYLVGQTLRIDQKKDGVVRMSRIDPISIYKLDTNEPGLYVAHLREPRSKMERREIEIELEKYINKWAKGSNVLVVGPEVGRIVEDERETE